MAPGRTTRGSFRNAGVCAARHNRRVRALARVMIVGLRPHGFACSRRGRWGERAESGHSVRRAHAAISCGGHARRVLHSLNLFERALASSGLNSRLSVVDASTPIFTCCDVILDRYAARDVPRAAAAPGGGSGRPRHGPVTGRICDVQSEETVGSRVRVISAIGCALVSFAALGCEQQIARRGRGQGCQQGQVLPCPCPDGRSTGFTTCGAHDFCGGCAPVMQSAAGSPQVSASAPAPALAAGAGAAHGGAVAGSIAPPPAGSGAASSPGLPGAIGGAPSLGGAGSASGGLNGCAIGEMCKPAPAGVARFCTANPAATTPPPGAAAGAACGTNSKGTCVEGTSLGSPGALYCIYNAC